MKNKNKSKFCKDMTFDSTKPLENGVIPTFIDSDEDDDY